MFKSRSEILLLEVIIMLQRTERDEMFLEGLFQPWISVIIWFLSFWDLFWSLLLENDLTYYLRIA